jgi:hypothetical protein
MRAFWKRIKSIALIKFDKPNDSDYEFFGIITMLFIFCAGCVFTVVELTGGAK